MNNNEDIEYEHDEVIREINVYGVDNLLNLYLLQFPLKPIYSEPPKEISNVKFKPKHKILEFEIPYPNGMNSSIPIATNQKYHSSTIRHETNIGIGVMRNNELHITALDEICQMRPNFQFIRYQNDIEREIDENEDNDEMYDGIKQEEPIMTQVQLKRKESERAQTTRIQSYGHLHTQVESEAWKRLEFHDINSEESIFQRYDRLYKQDNL